MFGCAQKGLEKTPKYRSRNDVNAEKPVILLPAGPLLIQKY